MILLFFRTPALEDQSNCTDRGLENSSIQPFDCRFWTNRRSFGKTFWGARQLHSVKDTPWDWHICRLWLYESGMYHALQQPNKAWQGCSSKPGAQAEVIRKPGSSQKDTLHPTNMEVEQGPIGRLNSSMNRLYSTSMIVSGRVWVFGYTMPFAGG